MATVTVIGAVGKDPELKFIQGKNGQFAVAEFPLADSQREMKNGEWQDGLTIWYKVSVTGKQAEVVADAVTKGMRLEISGDLKISEYEAKDGTRKNGFEIKAKNITEPIKSQGKPKPKVVAEDEPAWGASWN